MHGDSLASLPMRWESSVRLAHPYVPSDQIRTDCLTDGNLVQWHEENRLDKAMLKTLRTPWVIGTALLGPSTPVSRLERRVRATDCDFNRHLTNSMYPHYMDLGRWDLVVRSGAMKQCLAERARPLVVELNIKYRKELRHRTHFTLDTRFVALDGKALVIEQHFLVGDHIHASAVVRSLLVKDKRVIEPSLFAPFVTPPLED